MVFELNALQVSSFRLFVSHFSFHSHLEQYLFAFVYFIEDEHYFYFTFPQISSHNLFYNLHLYPSYYKQTYQSNSKEDSTDPVIQSYPFNISTYFKCGKSLTLFSMNDVY